MIRCASALCTLLMLPANYADGQAPSSPSLSVGMAFYTQGDLEAAIPALERAIQADSSLIQAYVALGSAYLGTQRYYLAELLTRTGSKRFPGLKALRVIEAESLMGQQEFRAALTIFKEVETELKRGPIPSLPDLDMAEVRGRLGHLHQLMGNRAVERSRPSDALIQFEQAIRYLPASLAAYHNSSLIHLQREDWELARRMTDLGLERFPDQTGLLQIKGAALFRLEVYDELGEVYESLFRLQPDSATVGITYATVLLQDQQTPRALEVFESLLERFPADRTVYDALIDWHNRTLNFPAVLATLRRLQKQFPSDAEVLRRIGIVYESMRQEAAARAVYDSVAALSGDVLAAQLAKARSFVREDSLEAAIDLLQRSIAVEAARTAEAAGAAAGTLEAAGTHEDVPPGSDEARLLRILGPLYERTAGWDDALATYSRLMQIDSTALPLVRSGYAHEQLGRPVEALAIYRQAVARGTRDPLPTYRIAVLIPGQDAPIFEMVDRALDLSLQAVRETQDRMRQQTQEATSAAGRSIDEDSRQLKSRLDSQNELSEEIFQFFVTEFPRENTEPVLLATLRQYPGSGRLHYLVGQFYLTQDESAAALRQFQEATRFAPELREAHLAQGLYYATTQEIMRAIQAYERALSLDPVAGDTYAALIPLYRSQNALDRLIDRWQARFRATPENITLREHLIEALHKAGRLEEAREIVRN